MNIVHKPIRTLSGVTPVTLLTKPYACPGRCAFCPTEVGMPKSYLSQEPAAQRAKSSHFHPRAQILNRLELYQTNQHVTDKLELIILGGTWSFYPKRYQTWFIKTCYDTCNGFVSKNLVEAQKANEQATHRIIGLTIETRPDYITLQEIKRLRQFGVTRVELGVQSVYDDVLKLNLRDHTIAETVRATRLLKQAGFKINYHIMPNLPGSDLSRDLEMFRILFTNSDFQPDMLKVYPCMLLEKTLAYKWYRQGKFVPYTTEGLVDLMVQAKQFIPPYVRIMRLYRDIPKSYVLAGSESSNLRQMIQVKLKQHGLKCQCIRCREIRDEKQERNLELRIMNYESSGGKEYFMQYIDSQDRIYGFLRLRINRKNTNAVFRALRDCALIRELHVYGQTTAIKSAGKVQHRGLGRELIKTAERITKEKGLSKIAVISGVGVRDYYRKQGYELKETYMIKTLPCPPL